MGQFKNQGDPALALAEECAEVIQVITKKVRFESNGNPGGWDSKRPDQTRTRWEELDSEMTDLIYQWERLKSQKAMLDEILSKM